MHDMVSSPCACSRKIYSRVYDYKDYNQMSNLSFSRSVKTSCHPWNAILADCPPSPRKKGIGKGRRPLCPAFVAGQAKCHGELFASAMSVLFFKRFLKRPLQIASIVPSSQALVDRVASKIDFDRARVIAEYGPGEGVHSRALAQRMRRDAQLLLFELDPAFSRDLARQFADDPRVCVINANAATIRAE